jgi:non-homologous end joining protein Ku
MPPRSTWKGFLKVSLVTIPVKVFPATESAATLSFNQLHAECQTRIQQKRWCPHCEREVSNTELAKGYEFETRHRPDVARIHRSHGNEQPVSGPATVGLHAASDR